MASSDGFECDTAAMRVLFGYDTFFEILHYLPRAQWFPLRCVNKLLQQYVSSICKTSTILRISDLRGACMNFSAERVLLCAHILTRSLLTRVHTVDFRDAEKDGTQPQQLGMRARKGIHSLSDIGRNGAVFCSPIAGPLLSCLAHNIGQRITSLCVAGLTLRTEALEALEHGLPCLETLDVTGVTATGVVDPDSYIGTPADPHRGQLAAIFGWTRRAGQAGRQGNVPASSAFSGVREPGVSPSQERLVFMQNAPVWAACRGGKLRHLYFTGTNLARRWKLDWFASTSPGLGLVSFETRFLEPDMLLSLAASSGYGTPPSHACGLTLPVDAQDSVVNAAASTGTHSTQGTTYESSLRNLTIVGTRVCELRINGPALEAVLQRLETLALIDCDLQPRPHLLQPPCDVLASILAASPRLRSLRLEDIPSPELRDGFWSELVHSIRGKKELLLSREAGKLLARHAKADKIAAIDPQAAAAYLASFAEEDGCVEAALAAHEGGRDRAGRMVLGPPPLQEIHISPANSMQLPAVRALCTLFGSSLRVFSIGGTLPRLNDACLSHLGSTCAQLEELHAPFCTDITDTGIVSLACSVRGPRLRRLNLSRCNLHRAPTLATLAERCRLQWLSIRGCHAAVMDGIHASSTPPLHTSAQATLLPGDQSYVSTTHALWNPVPAGAGPGTGGAAGEGWPHSTWQDIDSGMHGHGQRAYGAADARTPLAVATGADVLASLRARGATVVYEPSLRLADAATRAESTDKGPSLPASCTTFPCPNMADASTWMDATSGPLPRCTATCATQADLTDHMENVCTYGIMPCLNAGCSVRIPRYDLSRHLSDACTAYMIQCMLCPASVPRYKLEAHLQAHGDTEKAEDARIHCAFVSHGCGWSIPSAFSAMSSPGSTSTAPYPASEHHHHHRQHRLEDTACAGLAAAAKNGHRHVWRPGKHRGTGEAQGARSAYKCISCAADLAVGETRPPGHAHLCSRGSPPAHPSGARDQTPVDGIAPQLLCYVTGLLRCRMPHIEDCDACPPPVLLAAGSVHVASGATGPSGQHLGSLQEPQEVQVLQAQLQSLLTALNPALEPDMVAAAAGDATAIALARVQSHAAHVCA